MIVFNCDQKGDSAYIDLSKKNLQVQDVENKKNFFEKSKVVHLIMRLTAHQLRTKVTDLYQAFGWDLYDQYEHALDALQLCLTDSEQVMSKLDISEQQKKVLLANIQKKLSATPIKIRTIFKLTCLSFEGINAIKEALLATREQINDENTKVAFQMIVSPEYKAEIVTLDKQGGIDLLNKAVKIVAQEIKQRGGTFRMIQLPTKIGSNKGEFDSEQILMKANELAEAAEEEKEGDQDSEEDEDDMELDLDDNVAVEDDDGDTNSTAVSVA